MAVRETFGRHPVRGRRPATASVRSAQVSDLAETSDRRSPEVAKRMAVRETFGRNTCGVGDPRTARSAQVSDLAATPDRRSPEVAKRVPVRETFGRQTCGVGDPRTAPRSACDGSPTSPKPPTAGLLKWPNVWRCERPSVGTQCGVGDPRTVRSTQVSDLAGTPTAGLLKWPSVSIQETFGRHEVRGRRPAHSGHQVRGRRPADRPLV